MMQEGKVKGDISGMRENRNYAPQIRSFVTLLPPLPSSFWCHGRTWRRKFLKEKRRCMEQNSVFRLILSNESFAVHFSGYACG